MKSWDNKAAVVTGGASGIGLALARGLVQRGVKVVLADIEQQSLDRAQTELKNLGGVVVSKLTDVADYTQVQALAAFAMDSFGPTHLLFNNAGVSITGPTWQLSLDDWRWVWSVNVAGVVHGIKAFLPAMLEHGQESYVVNTGSLASFGGNGDHAPYCATKAAVLGISQALYSEMRAMKTQVGVSIVCPGIVNTRIHQSWRNRPAEDQPWSRREMEDQNHIALSEAFQSSGRSVEDVAEATYAGMLEDRFYIFTHGGAENYVRALLEPAIQGRNPYVSTWGEDRRTPEEQASTSWQNAFQPANQLP